MNLQTIMFCNSVDCENAYDEIIISINGKEIKIFDYSNTDRTNKAWKLQSINFNSENEVNNVKNKHNYFCL